jgi:hypothetical protein
VNYSALDRLIHRFAFAVPLIQQTAADIERATFGAVYKDVVATRPIFITSLPRAGTTLLLEILHHSQYLATHIYRDMPFVMAPIIWSKLSGAFHKNSELHERAHGDGVQVGYDSPEAFEEIIWHAFWPEKYTDTGIALWGENDSKAAAQDFFVEHMKRIIALRCRERVRDGRYISKNNANIARLDLIPRIFPDARILVPVRHPLEHAASLLLQHRNFIEMHRNEPFSRRYMADLGHYEFGELHKPIAFPGLDTLISDLDPLVIDYWIGYWIAAFEYVLVRRDSVILVSYEAICTDGPGAMEKVLERLDIDDYGVLDAAARLLRSPPEPRHNNFPINPRLRERAEALYKSLFST